MIYIPIFVNVALLLLFGYRYLFFSLVFFFHYLTHKYTYPKYFANVSNYH